MSAFLPESVAGFRRDGETCAAEFRLLAKGEAGLVLKLQEEVLTNESDAKLYHPLSAAEAKLMVEGQGVTMGAFVDGRLVAFYAVFFPHLACSNLGRDVDLPPEHLTRVAHFEAVCVHPHFRGNGLQKLLIRRLIHFLRATPYDLLFQTVSPFNLPSVTNCLAAGFAVCAVKQKYGQEWRYILFRHRDVPLPWENKSRITVPLTDFAGQQRAFAEGYVGVEILREDNEMRLALIKRKSMA